MTFHLCEICKKTAKFKDTPPLRKGSIEKYNCYCKQHAEEGINFGWLEEYDLEEIKW